MLYILLYILDDIWKAISKHDIKIAFKTSSYVSKLFLNGKVKPIDMSIPEFMNHSVRFLEDSSTIMALHILLTPRSSGCSFIVIFGRQKASSMTFSFGS